ncbi:hypothetical protein HCU66_16630 [Pseudomonas frederiksbergensis]|uniref:Tc toxin subunit A n=1 Tax=Pseudomonas frederiksbergensis TaxID=104087 RepID=UPI00198266B5|nr:Tc toxin subunit A [Pseudomonas frederiksbergensis]MBN3863866.1 hypothetical protein [Pseudomonas frederiksbergensis]
MTASPAQIAQQMFAQATGKSKRSTSAALTRFFKAGGSVTLLAQRGVDRLMRDYKLNRQQARQFQERLNVLSTAVLRRFIEHQLSGESVGPIEGGLDNGPTYVRVFKTKFDTLCPPNAIEAVHSPAAYLVALLHWALKRLGETDDSAFPLITRRADLEKLRIDFMAVHGSVSSVQVITGIMEKFIEATLGALQDLDEELSKQAFPHELPFHWPWVTIDHVLKGHAESVGSVVRQCDRQYPYFLRSTPWSDKSDVALVQSARLSPSLRTLLTEAAHFPGGASSFYPRYFGLKAVEGPNLANVYLFNERAKLVTSSLEALLSIEGALPVLSVNAPGHVVGTGPDPVTGKDFGSVFIHEGKIPPITIRHAENDLLNRFEGMTEDRIDRIQRMLRLSDALELQFPQTDQLMVAANHAETPLPTPPPYWVTPNTLRALGLFQELRNLSVCPPEDFAAFIWRMSVFGTGTEPSHFDRVFNGAVPVSKPLILDGRAFPIIPVTEADVLTVKQLRRGLGIDQETYFYLAHLIAAAHGLDDLTCSLPIVSSFYRMARLPRMLGISAIEAILLLQLMGGEAWVKQLAGVPTINSAQTPDVPDALSVIHALADCVRWLQAAQLPAHWVLQQATAWPRSQPDEVQRTLFESWRRQVPAALMTEDALKMAGVAPLSNSRQWLQALTALVDERGLIRHFAESAERSYEAYAREMTEIAVEAATGVLDKNLVELIVAVLMRCRGGQGSVVVEGLVAYSGLAANLVLQVLGWSGGTVHYVLTQVLGMSQGAVGDVFSGPLDEEPNDPVLDLLAEFSRRSAVVAMLGLNSEFLTYYIATNPAQGVHPSSTEAFNLPALYELTVYKRALAMISQPEERLLDYLRRMHALPGNLSNDGLELVNARAAKWLAELFNCSVAEVLACARQVNPEKGLIVTLGHLDGLTRIRLLAEKTGQTAETLIKIGTLPPDSHFAAYTHVADLVRASLSNPPDPTYADDIRAVEQQDVLVSWTTNPHPVELIAKKPDEFATFTVTVTNSTGVALLNVNVHCESALGRFERPMITTGSDGTATVKFYPDGRMGTVTPVYALDLRDKVPAPRVEIVPDRTTLHVKTEDPFPLPASSVPVGTLVTFRAIVQDNYGNLIADEPVFWTLSPLPQPGIETRTDSQGVAVLTFTQAEASTVNVKAKASNGTEVEFRQVEFVAVPAEP